MEDADHDASDEREGKEARENSKSSAKAAIISMEQSIIRANF